MSSRDYPGASGRIQVVAQHKKDMWPAKNMLFKKFRYAGGLLLTFSLHSGCADAN